MRIQRIRWPRHIGFSQAILIGIVCVAAWKALAQEAINEGAEVEENRRARQKAIDRNLYNLKAGPVLMRFDAVMGFEFTDNPNLVEHPDEVDFAFRPELDIATLWALNSQNALALNLGVGYVKYVNNTELDHVLITPSSELALDIKTGDFTINLHERVSYTQNPINDPTVSGTGDFGGIENTVGARVDWDLNHVVFSVGYDHYNFISTSSGVSQQFQQRSGTTMKVTDVQDRSADLFYGRAGMRVSPAILTGVEAGGGFTDYESDFFHDNTQFSVGPFVEAQISRDIRARAAGGYVRSDFDSMGISRAPKSVNDFYAELSVEHQLSQYMTHRLSVGREARAGVEAELVTLWYARYQNDLNLNRFSTLHSTIFYENGRERSGVTERFWRVGAGIGVTVPLSRKLNVTVAYQLLYKDSDQANRDYLQNVLSLEFRYAF
jgi:hypothetical protein